MRKFNNILNILLKFSLKETKMKAIQKQKYTSMNKIIFIGRIILLLQKHNTTETVEHTLRKTLCQYYARYSSCLCTLWTQNPFVVNPSQGHCVERLVAEGNQ